jgi:tripartite motif-containing protein 66
MESEDATRFTDSVGQGPKAPGLGASKDLVIPSELEEPINLSVKKLPLVPLVNTSTALQQYQSPKGEPAFQVSQGLEQRDSALPDEIKTGR